MEIIFGYKLIAKDYDIYYNQETQLSFIIKCNDNYIGLFLSQYEEDVIYLDYIGIKEQYHKKGLGTYILNYFIDN